MDAFGCSDALPASVPWEAGPPLLLCALSLSCVLQLTLLRLRSEEAAWSGDFEFLPLSSVPPLSALDASAAAMKGLNGLHSSGCTSLEASCLLLCDGLWHAGVVLSSWAAGSLLTWLSELVVFRVGCVAGVAGCCASAGADRAKRRVLWDLPRAAAAFARQWSADYTRLFAMHAAMRPLACCKELSVLM